MNINSHTLLWTNPSPSSAFNPQTISLDLSQYKYVVITYKTYSSHDTTDRGSVFLPLWVGFGCLVVGKPSDAFFSRTFTLSSTGVSFYIGGYVNASSASDTPDACIPLKIYGVK